MNFKASNLLWFIFCCFACCNSKHDTKNDQDNQSFQNCYVVISQLSKPEKNFISKLAKENDALFCSNEVKRVYSLPDSQLICSQMIVPKDTLISRGYVYYEFMYYGRISDESEISINYAYNRGQADYGYGSVTGILAKDYYHTISGYGMTNKIVELYHNGQKLYQKVLPLQE